MTNEDKLRNIIKKMVNEAIISQPKETEREKAMASLRITLEEWLGYIETDYARIKKYEAEANEALSELFKTQIKAYEKDIEDNTITFSVLLQPQMVLKACLEHANREELEESYGDLNSLSVHDVALIADDVLSDAIYIDKDSNLTFWVENNMVEASVEFPLLMNYCDLNYRLDHLFED